jgi:hypothetical protein
MRDYSSPLESLAAFAIAFAAGSLSTVIFGTYVRWLKQQNQS